jgi:hypothetical protein
MTSAFIAAFQRFTEISHVDVVFVIIFKSNNAITFKRTDYELKNYFKAASTFYKMDKDTLTNAGMSWTLIPPNTPPYSSLGEAGIKNVKHYLKRAFHTHTLTFEEFNTMFTDIEACINSR